MTVSSALTKTGGYQYTAEIELTETAGVAATIASVTFPKLDWFGGTAEPFAQFGPEAWAGSNVVPGRGTLKSRPLVAILELPDMYYEVLKVSIKFSDEASDTPHWMEVTATTPPIPEPPPGALFNLIGKVWDDHQRALSEVTLEVEDGRNAGRKTTTDATGAFTLARLEPSTFTVAFSKTGYKTGSYTTELKSNRTFDVRLETDPSALALSR